METLRFHIEQSVLIKQDEGVEPLAGYVIDILSSHDADVQWYAVEAPGIGYMDVEEGELIARDRDRGGRKFIPYSGYGSDC